MKDRIEDAKIFTEVLDKMNLTDEDLTEDQAKVLFIMKLIRSKCKITYYYPFDNRIKLSRNNPEFTKTYILKDWKGEWDALGLECKGYKITLERPTISFFSSFYFKVIDNTDSEEDVTFSIPLFYQFFKCKKEDVELIELFKEDLLKTLDKIVEYKERGKRIHEIYKKKEIQEKNSINDFKKVLRNEV